VLNSLGLSPSDFYPEKDSKKNSGEWDIVAAYQYKNEAGDLLYERVRYRNKYFAYLVVERFAPAQRFAKVYHARLIIVVM
jgi:hypothetical protein